eukprot:TRINITY_DN4153_c0_g1_i10.p1 TRINITY_DN4153_c0_g1~~TRINITY_DN4153_c0_g1_i10.p1  ORF type:complete len:104 (+),score=17.13 TRINITY_DN4153_c0_g1_i10:373-684(+)
MSEKQGEGAKLYQNYLGEGTVKPANVSITCFMDWLDFINESYQKEYLLKKQILLNINYTIPSAKLQKLSQIWTSHSNIPLKEVIEIIHKAKEKLDTTQKLGGL